MAIRTHLAPGPKAWGAPKFRVFVEQTFLRPWHRPYINSVLSALGLFTFAAPGTSLLKVALKKTCKGLRLAVLLAFSSSNAQKVQRLDGKSPMICKKGPGLRAESLNKMSIQHVLCFLHTHSFGAYIAARGRKAYQANHSLTTHFDGSRAG